MKFKDIQKRHQRAIERAGQETWDFAEDRAQRLFQSIREVYPQLTDAATGMGLSYFSGDSKIPARGETGDVTTMSAEDLFEWTQVEIEGVTRKWVTPQGMTPAIKSALIELVELLDWIARTPELPNVQIKK